MNRAQRRQFQFGNRHRGVGFTRQFSSARARKQHGTHCKGPVPRHDAAKLADIYRQLMAVQSELQTQEDTSDSGVNLNFQDEFDSRDVIDAELLSPPATEDEVEIEEPNGSWSETRENSVDLSTYQTLTAREVISKIKAGDYDTCLDQVRDLEEGLKQRKTVLEAIMSRV